VVSFRCIICNDSSLPTEVIDHIKGDPIGTLTAVRCSSCGHIQLDPPEYSLDFYEENGQVNNVMRMYGTPMNVLVEHSWIEARRRVQRFANYDIQLVRGDRPLRVLDIGGGYGFFAAELMRAVPGIEVVVVEPSTARVALGKTYLAEAGPGTPVPEFLSEIVDEAFATRHARTFDIVTLWHVLEHLIDPVGLLRHAARLVRGDGVVCVEVPNVDDELQALSPSFRERSFMAEHISYFSSHTLETAARRAGAFGHVNVHGYQRYGIFNYFHWIHTNKPQGVNPDLFEGTDRWWLEATWRAARESARTSDALLMVARPPQGGLNP